MDIKLTNSYKLVIFNVVVVTTYKRCHTVAIKFTNLMLLKTDELKALDCQLEATSAFLFQRRNLKEHYNFISALSVKFLLLFYRL